MTLFGAANRNLYKSQDVSFRRFVTQKRMKIWKGTCKGIRLAYIPSIPSKHKNEVSTCHCQSEWNGLWFFLCLNRRNDQQGRNISRLFDHQIVVPKRVILLSKCPNVCLGTNEIDDWEKERVSEAVDLIKRNPKGRSENSLSNSPFEQFRSERDASKLVFLTEFGRFFDEY